MLLAFLPSGVPGVPQPSLLILKSQQVHQEQKWEPVSLAPIAFPPARVLPVAMLNITQADLHLLLFVVAVLSLLLVGALAVLTWLLCYCADQRVNIRDLAGQLYDAIQGEKRARALLNEAWHRESLSAVSSSLRDHQTDPQPADYVPPKSLPICDGCGRDSSQGHAPGCLFRVDGLEDHAPFPVSDSDPLPPIKPEEVTHGS